MTVNIAVECLELITEGPEAGIFRSLLQPQQLADREAQDLAHYYCADHVLWIWVTVE